MGPGTKRNERRVLPDSSSRISVPVISEGMRSGVNCTRLKLRSNASPRLRTINVLANPGTPNSRQCPRESNAVNI